MADITRTATQVAPTDPIKMESFPSIAVEAVEAGQWVAPAAGGVNLADANQAGARQQVCGMALNKAGIGQAVTVMTRGPVYGFDVSARTPGDPIFLSDTIGEVGDAASATKTVRVGRVIQTTDKSLTKLLYVDIDMAHVS